MTFLDRDVWLSNDNLTVWVTTVGDTITEAPLVLNKFVGQPIDNLMWWMTLFCRCCAWSRV